MFTLVYADNSGYSVLDEVDNTTDVLTATELTKLLKIGVRVGGAGLNDKGILEYSREHFIKKETSRFVFSHKAGDYYYVEDTVDKEIEAVSKATVQEYLNIGVKIEGILRKSDTEFTILNSTNNTQESTAIAEPEEILELEQTVDDSRFCLVGEQADRFAIYDKQTNDIDIYDRTEIQGHLNNGLTILGITRKSSTEFVFTSEYFIKDEDEEDGFEDSEEVNDSDDDSDDGDISPDDIEPEPDEDQGDGSSDDVTVADIDYYDEDDEDEDDYSEKKIDTRIKELYGMLTPDQLEVLRRYYLAVSQESFETQVGTKLQLKSSKLAVLNSLRKTGLYWQYAGYIDMGDTGSIHCERGHALRYVHLAWDSGSADLDTTFWGNNYSLSIASVLESPNCLVFGASCVSDFFEVDREKMKLQLMKLQRESVEDMHLLHTVYKNNLVDLYKDSFALFDSLMSKLVLNDSRNSLFGKTDEVILPRLLTSFYLQFKASGMVYPYSLIQNIRNYIFQWSTSKVREVRDANVAYILDFCKVVFRKKFDTASMLSESMYKGYLPRKSMLSFKAYLQVFFRYKLCGEYSYQPGKFERENGKSKVVVNHYSSLYHRASKVGGFWADVEYTMEYLEKTVDARMLELKLEDLFIPQDYVYTVEIVNSDGTHGLSAPLKISGRWQLSDYFRMNTDLHPVVQKLLDWTTAPATVEEFLTRGNEILPQVEDFRTHFEELSRNKAQSSADKYNIERSNRTKKVVAPSPVSTVEPDVQQVTGDGWVEQPSTVVDGIVKLLDDKDYLDYINKQEGYECTLGLKILNTVTKYRSIPSEKQYEYLKKLAYKLIEFRDSKKE